MLSLTKYTMNLNYKKTESIDKNWLVKLRYPRRGAMSSTLLRTAISMKCTHGRQCNSPEFRAKISARIKEPQNKAEAAKWYMFNLGRHIQKIGDTAFKFSGQGDRSPHKTIRDTLCAKAGLGLTTRPGFKTQTPVEAAPPYRSTAWVTAKCGSTEVVLSHAWCLKSCGGNKLYVISSKWISEAIRHRANANF